MALEDRVALTFRLTSWAALEDVKLSRSVINYIGGDHRHVIKRAGDLAAHQIPVCLLARELLVTMGETTDVDALDLLRATGELLSLIVRRGFDAPPLQAVVATEVSKPVIAGDYELDVLAAIDDRLVVTTAGLAYNVPPEAPVRLKTETLAELAKRAEASAALEAQAKAFVKGMRLANGVIQHTARSIADAARRAADAPSPAPADASLLRRLAATYAKLAREHDQPAHRDLVGRHARGRKDKMVDPGPRVTFEEDTQYAVAGSVLTAILDSAFDRPARRRLQSDPAASPRRSRHPLPADLLARASSIGGLAHPVAELSRSIDGTTAARPHSPLPTERRSHHRPSSRASRASSASLGNALALLEVGAHSIRTSTPSRASSTSSQPVVRSTASLPKRNADGLPVPSRPASAASDDGAFDRKKAICKQPGVLLPSLGKRPSTSASSMPFPAVTAPPATPDADLELLEALRTGFQQVPPGMLAALREVGIVAVEDLRELAAAPYSTRSSLWRDAFFPRGISMVKFVTMLGSVQG
jgi:hypothetical protein